MELEIFLQQLPLKMRRELYRRRRFGGPIEVVLQPGWRGKKEHMEDGTSADNDDVTSTKERDLVPPTTAHGV